jgi:hypothetical protein
MIDIHTHLGRWGTPGEETMDEAELLRQMDRLGIAQAVILPFSLSPEVSMFPFDTDAVLGVYRRHPDRIIPFCNMDPRTGNSPEADFGWIFEEFKAAGCRGLGELVANIHFDDPRCVNLYRQCAQFSFPIVFHLAVDVAYGLYGVADEMGLPRLERMLRECPDTVFIGHAMGFWSEIASNVEPATRGGYPDEKVAGQGRVPELLRKYPNLYGDLSAGSGLNAISRDPEFGYRFLEEHQDKLLFGTDICHVNQEVEIVPYLNQALAEAKISQTCYDKICHLNARMLLGL